MSPELRALALKIKARWDREYETRNWIIPGLSVETLPTKFDVESGRIHVPMRGVVVKADATHVTFASELSAYKGTSHYAQIENVIPDLCNRVTAAFLAGEIAKAMTDAE